MKDILIEQVADVAEEGDMVDHYFSIQSGLSPEDRVGLSQKVAAILRGWASAPEEIQACVLLVGMDNGEIPGFADAAWEANVMAYQTRMMGRYAMMLKAGKE